MSSFQQIMHNMTKTLMEIEKHKHVYILSCYIIYMMKDKNWQKPQISCYKYIQQNCNWRVKESYSDNDIK
jgi:hypothetical protein